jgi:hypothetical protein
MVELAKLIPMQTVELEGAVRGICSIKSPKYIEECCIEANRLEHIADDVLAHAVTDLFRTQHGEVGGCPDHRLDTDPYDPY